LETFVEWLRAARLFSLVVQKGSLSAAGRQFGLSPASVSRHINALEEGLGARLLNRTSRRLTLTEAGEIYHAQVEQILNQINEANESVARLHSAPRGTLRVHSRMLVGQQFIVPALPDFLAAYPEIKIDLMLSNVDIDLVAANVDIDVRIGNLTDSSLVARKLTSAERVVCASKDYMESAGPVCSPADLLRHNCLTYKLNMGRAIWRFLDQDGSLVEVPITGTLQSDSGPALLSAMRAGVGIAIMPDWSIRDDLESGRVVRLLPEYQASHIEFDNGVYAVYQRTRPASPKVRILVDFLADLFKKRPLAK
jgi:DNA-binding transcriptional LysR family regulator